MNDTDRSGSFFFFCLKKFWCHIEAVRCNATHDRKCTKFIGLFNRKKFVSCRLDIAEQNNTVQPACCQLTYSRSRKKKQVFSFLLSVVTGFPHWWLIKLIKRKIVFACTWSSEVKNITLNNIFQFLCDRFESLSLGELLQMKYV